MKQGAISKAIQRALEGSYTAALRRCLNPGDVAQISPEHDCPLSRHSSADGFDLGPAKGREAVHDGDADLDFGGLAGGVS